MNYDENLRKPASQKDLMTLLLYFPHPAWLVQPETFLLTHRVYRCVFFVLESTMCPRRSQCFRNVNNGEKISNSTTLPNLGILRKILRSQNFILDIITKLTMYRPSVLMLNAGWKACLHWATGQNWCQCNVQDNHSRTSFNKSGCWGREDGSTSHGTPCLKAHSWQ